MIKSTIMSVLIVGGSKGSGLIRDMLVIALMGITADADAVFFSMTILMFFQLVSYQSSINRFGYLRKGGKWYCLLNDWKYAVGLILVTFLLQLLIVYLAYDFSLILKYTMLFLSISPLAIIVGYSCASKVLDGNRNSHVVVTLIQNIVLIVTFSLIVYGDRKDLIFLSWTLAWCVAYIYLIYSNGKVSKKIKDIENSGSVDKSASLALIISPMMMFLTILVERYFYSSLEGGLALIKILETITMSIIFLLEVIIYNKLMAVVKRKICTTAPRSESVSIIFSGFIKSLVIGLVIYVVIMVLFFSFKDNFSVFSTLSDEVLSFILPACVLYGVYFAAALGRDYSDRMIYLLSREGYILRVNVLIFISTVVINLVFIEYAPYTVLITSVVLLIIKSSYGFFLLKSKSLVR